MFKQLYLRIRYWRQLRQGFKLIHDHGAKRHFAIAGDKAFIMNGVDPLVRVDLSTGKAISAGEVWVDKAGLRTVKPNPNVVDKDFVWPANGIHGVGIYEVGTDPKKVNGHIDV